MSKFPNIRRRVFAAISFATISLGMGASSAQAGEVRGVVELFTSQGCHSCPPADQALVNYAARGDVLALGYHVDYWDYLGWKDTLGSAENTARQRAYAKTLKARTVYTPQAVIDGKDHVVGGDVKAIEARLGDALPIPVSIDKFDDRLSVSIGAPVAKPSDGDVRITLVYFRNESPVKIERGENAGKFHTYANAVIARQVMGMWKGDAATMDMPVSEMMKHGADNCAVLLQIYDAQGNPGEIVGAAVLDS
ncbi:MAG: DUF1223 domain-containing protein [Pseudomonadota bacterium]